MYVQSMYDSFLQYLDRDVQGVEGDNYHITLTENGRYAFFKHVYRSSINVRKNYAFFK